MSRDAVSLLWQCAVQQTNVAVQTPLCVSRYSVQPKLHRAVRGPGHGDEGHPGGTENEGADPEGTTATSPAGHGGEAVRPQLSGPQQLQS